MDPRPRSKTEQVEWYRSPRFMQSQGKQEWKVTRGGYNMEKHRPEQRIEQWLSFYSQRNVEEQASN